MKNKQATARDFESSVLDGLKDVKQLKVLEFIVNNYNRRDNSKVLADRLLLEFEAHTDDTYIDLYTTKYIDVVLEDTGINSVWYDNTKYYIGLEEKEVE